jgi:ferrous iron transport protein A
MRRISLTQMESGESGVIVSVAGGRGLKSRLDSMGIRVGVRVRKISAQILKGPVTVQIGTTQIALGFGMAQRVLVEVVE